jgi:glutamyl-tRNA reductase
MTVLVVGLSHRSAPVDLLERAVLGPDAAAKLLEDVLASDHASEALVLSTCNRIEVYAEVDKFHGGLAQVSELLARQSAVDLDELTPHLYVHYEDRAVAHLFSVACGLDSMVVGESQVLGQVRAALRIAQDSGTVGRQLGELAQQALRVGKRARTETGIDRAGRSLVTAGLEHASAVVGPVDGLDVLVVGAGAMSALAATVVAQSGGRVTVANRTFDRGSRLADTVGGRAIELADVPAALIAADLVVSCTGAVGHVLGADLLAAAVAARPVGGRALVVLDLALPRDVDPAAGELDGLAVIDLETLAEVLATGEHVADVDAARTIVAEEVAAFLGWQRAVSVAPTVVALREMADAVVRSELVRLNGRVPDLDDRERSEIALTVTRVVEKLLHVPTVRVKELATEPGGQAYADALGKLFDLDLEAVEAVTRADVEGGGGRD